MYNDKRIRKIDPVKVAELIKQDPEMSFRKMSAKLGVSVWAISLWFKRHPGFNGYSGRASMNDRAGELHRLLEEDPSRTRKELAMLLGVKYQTLSSWICDHPEVTVVKEKSARKAIDYSSAMSFDEVKEWSRLGLPLNYKSIAEAFGVSGSRVRRWLAARPDVRKWIKLEKNRSLIAKIEALLAEDPGLSYVKLSSRLGVPIGRLHRLIPGRNVGKVAMTPERVKMFVEAVEAGPRRTCAQLAQFLGISPSALRKYFKKNPEMKRKWAILWYGEVSHIPEKDVAVVKMLEDALLEEPRRTTKELASMLGVSTHTIEYIMKRNPRLRVMKVRKAPRKDDDPVFMAALKMELERNPRASWAELAESLGVSRTLVMCVVRDYMGIVKPQAKNPGKASRKG